MRRLALGLLLAVVLTGCGAADEEPAQTTAATPATLQASALPELSARARTLNSDALAQDSFTPEALEGVLEDAGYMTGSEREFFGHSSAFEHVVARSLRFRDPEGADTYLDWLAANRDDFLGSSKPEPSFTLGESQLLFSLVPCAACKKERPTFLAAWRRGATVAFLLGAGPGASRESFDALAAKLDERIAV